MASSTRHSSRARWLKGYLQVFLRLVSCICESTSHPEPSQAFGEVLDDKSISRGILFTTITNTERILLLELRRVAGGKQQKQEASVDDDSNLIALSGHAGNEHDMGAD